jgi:hypothetical protein
MGREMRHVLFEGLAEIDDPGVAKALEQVVKVHRGFHSAVAK